MTSLVPCAENLDVHVVALGQAKTRCQFFQLGIEERPGTHCSISEITSAHLSVLRISRDRATHTHHSQSQNQRADRLQVTVGWMQHIGSKATDVIDGVWLACLLASDMPGASCWQSMQVVLGRWPAVTKCLNRAGISTGLPQTWQGIVFSSAKSFKNPWSPLLSHDHPDGKQDPHP